jgi:hypothetical protein
MAENRTRCGAALLVSCLLPLAGCGGGGSYNAPAAPVFSPGGGIAQGGTPLNLQAANTSVTYQAAAATAMAAKWGAASISAAGQGATITLSTDAKGDLTTVVIPAGGINNTFSGGAGSKLSDSNTLYFGYQLDDFTQFTNEVSYTISQAATGAGLTASAFGEWFSNGNTLPGNAGVIAFGNLTAPGSVPATGSATYNGNTIGMGGAADGSSVFTVMGNAQIIANFATQNVTTNLTALTAGNVAFASKTVPSVPDLSGMSALSGNAYSGPIAGGGLTGTINGNFYGASAQETAGVWQASGGGIAWIGSFGANK